MKDTNGNQITEEEFMKDIGHGVVEIKNNWEEKVRNDYKDIISDEMIEDTIKYWEVILAEQKKELLEEERRFILNVLDGIDIADKKAGVIGGTQAIRQALQSRVI